MNIHKTITNLALLINHRAFLFLNNQNEFLKNFTGIVCDLNKIISHFQNGKFHNKNGPAIYYVNGYKEWWMNGKCHRLNEPAVIRPDGMKKWYVNDKLHRLNGPACEYPDGRKSWYIHGISYTEQNYWKELKTFSNK